MRHEHVQRHPAGGDDVDVVLSVALPEEDVAGLGPADAGDPGDRPEVILLELAKEGDLLEFQVNLIRGDPTAFSFC
jgi:hypothetical protein